MTKDIRPSKDRPVILRMREDVEITEKLVDYCIRKYRPEIRRYKRLERYYMTENAIADRVMDDDTKPNNRLAHAFPRYISRIATAYFMGLGVRLKCEDEQYKQLLDDLITGNMSDVKHFEQAKEMSKKGKAYELLYINEDGKLKTAFLPADEVIPIYGQSAGRYLVAAIHVYKIEVFDGNGGKTCEYADVYTQTLVYSFKRGATGWQKTEEYDHTFSDVPVIVRWNNTEQKGDYEDVITLIDAYDRAQSDTSNDMDYFTDAYLAISGAEDIVIGDEDGNGDAVDSKKSIRTMREERMLFFPDGGDAKFVTKTIADAPAENYKSRLYKDIFFLALVPNLTDESFSGNLAGVAMKYKLFGLEELSAEKDKYFTSSELKKLRLMTEYLNILHGTSFDWRTLELEFDRSSIANLLEIAQIINYLRGLLSDETLISMWPEIKDAAKELEKRLQEKAKSENDELPPDLEKRLKDDDG